ncbi:MAG: hypothetical protein H7A21_08480 [Spirochaetales bacterium]|nr:hypothetical protein [Leptospiraceae bacterium]MCP5481452.1 hypothetical protein [Spirochaetales bacterium]
MPGYDGKDAALMKRLAREGKAISRIVAEDFPMLDYWTVYVEVYGSGGRSSQGIKKMISMRLAKLVDAHKAERREIVEELQELVADLYKKHRANQQKLDSVRKAMDA